jgi:DNA-binding SARP family transcriptional activator
VRIHLFGRPHLTRDERPLRLRAPRALSLLAYLLVHADTPLGRDAVAFALWPDERETDARANLRRHLFALITEGLPAESATPWILADKRTIQWNPDAPAWCDVHAFARLSAQPTHAAEAAALYRGELLEGFEDEWLQAPRERERERQIALLLDLIATSRTNADHVTAIECARRLLALDPWREDAVRALIELRGAAGDRAGALAAYRDFAARLEAEFGVAPMPATTAVHDAIAASTSDATPTAILPRRAIVSAEALLRVPSFTGRAAELGALHAALWERRTPVAVSGLAGIGKTALVREYARRHCDEYGSIWWLAAATEDGIVDSLALLGDDGGAGSMHAPGRRAVAARIAGTLAEAHAKPALLIFDDADDERLVRSWAPAGAHIIVTSRRAFGGPEFTPLRLDVPELDDAARYVRSEIGRPGFSAAQARELALALGSLPLALAHAAAHLNAMANVPVGRFIEYIDHYLDRAPRGAGTGSVYAALHAEIAHADAEAPGSAALLCLAAAMPTARISERAFAQHPRRYADLTPNGLAAARSLRATIADQLAKDAALGTLDAYALLAFAPATRTYRLHPLVARAARLFVGASGPAWDANAAALESGSCAELGDAPSCASLAAARVRCGPRALARAASRPRVFARSSTPW